ncbi:acyl-CoA dehydrogenase, C-terminal domain protein [Mycobacterium kansasii 732]|uniref:Acyl-CoA dehydrogenase FadE34 n=1 Tax=Mycobacterium pseudokansasii TaxID=2341080 RepID=A0A498QW70_9MYCO|nr:acyl-CoA dehydrogenase family protein [Mycobacterium pseudokansasii]EUA11340.1 acyl-CoA dehydrogenase, C-terminal domain protein [Mycobacterium kansasii 732]KZS68059.1 acyl-CoA dehydrogenase [Mycobacterium kansasii]MBY0390626.1 acyl-CoA/acyl-ACP dehydrogenase [Mycobacterium pseudokansasii]VAZ99739.1 Acyl-CoA dehydrogenase FadE34 [Mycobacterium pseudokansasii]VBA30938.1 Acyl-CoA dehydrogenase FadE34 [Mycobacterium pseudokansasii]
MNLELSEEQVALRDTVRRFLTERAPISGHVRMLLDDPTGTTEPVWRGLAALGTTGLLVPGEYGGAGMTMVEAGIVAEELGAALHPGPWLSTAIATTRALRRCDAGRAAAQIFTGIAEGTTIATVGPLDVETLPTADGTVLNGELVSVPDAAAAHVLLVLAQNGYRTELFAVDTASPGVSVAPERDIDRTRKTFRIGLDGVTAHRLATPSPAAVAAVVDDVLIGMAADALGAARAVMDSAVEYAKVRKQFGRAIGSFQAIQQLCVGMYETVELARSGVIHALWASDALPDDAADERHLCALRAKAFAGRLATVADTAIQIFGGIGYTWEHDAHLYLKRLLSWSAFRGGPDRYLIELGARLARPRTEGCR